MEHFFSQNLFSVILAALMSLILYIFGQQQKKITEIEKICRTCPINGITAIIAEIRNDIKWIKENLTNK